MTRRVALVAMLLPVLAAAAGEPPLRLDVNAATVGQLEKLPGMNRKKAETIVRVRERNGPYRRVEELRQLPGLTKRQYERLLEWVTVRKTEGSKPCGSNH